MKNENNQPNISLNRRTLKYKEQFTIYLESKITRKGESKMRSYPG